MHHPRLPSGGVREKKTLARVQSRKDERRVHIYYENPRLSFSSGRCGPGSRLRFCKSLSLAGVRSGEGERSALVYTAASWPRPTSWCPSTYYLTESTFKSSCLTASPSREMFYAMKGGWRGETARGRWDTYVFFSNFVVLHSRKINIKIYP